MSRISMHEGQRGQRGEGRKQRLRKKTLGGGHDKLCAWIPILYRDSNHIADLRVKKCQSGCWLLRCLAVCGSVEVSVTATLMVSAYLDAQGVTDIWSLFNPQNFLTF